MYLPPADIQVGDTLLRRTSLVWNRGWRQSILYHPVKVVRITKTRIITEDGAYTRTGYGVRSKGQRPPGKLCAYEEKLLALTRHVERELEVDSFIRALYVRNAPFTDKELHVLSEFQKQWDRGALKI